MHTLLLDRTGREVADFEVPDEVAPFLQHLAEHRPLKLRQMRDEQFLRECGISKAAGLPGLDMDRTFLFFEFDEETSTAIYVEVGGSGN
jgi:hypothetical protein